jgi:thiol-disulfide isomerase/thioredoxin
MAEFSLLVFTAGWCPACEGVGALVARAAQGLGIAIETVDIDADVDLAEQHRVHAVPTYLRMRGPAEDGRTEGLPTAAALRAFMLGGEQGRRSLPG